MAAFSIAILNIDTNVSAPGVNNVLNLTLYSTHADAIYNLSLPPSKQPLANSTFNNGTHYGINFKMLNETLIFGEGILYGGSINCSKGNIVLYYKWELIINDGEATYTEFGSIIVYL